MRTSQAMAKSPPGVDMSIAAVLVPGIAAEHIPAGVPGMPGAPLAKGSHSAGLKLAERAGFEPAVPAFTETIA
jgi:hypothetical protein